MYEPPQCNGLTGTPPQFQPHICETDGDTMEQTESQTTLLYRCGNLYGVELSVQTKICAIRNMSTNNAYLAGIVDPIKAHLLLSILIQCQNQPYKHKHISTYPFLA